MRALLFLIASALAISPKYAAVVRDLMTKQQSPPWVTIQDAVQRDNLAFTSADRQHIYVDFDKFKDAPHTLQTVIKHEIAHAQGRVHNDGSAYMQYHATEDSTGNVIDDASVIP